MTEERNGNEKAGLESSPRLGGQLSYQQQPSFIASRMGSAQNCQVRGDAEVLEERNMLRKRVRPCPATELSYS